MELKITPEWCRAAAEREGDADIGACSPEIAERARELARERGHKDVDELITCEGGAKIPVWQFYIGQAALAGKPRA